VSTLVQHCIEILNEICREKNPNCASRGSRFAANFIQNLYTVLKKRLWESRSTPTLAILTFAAELWENKNFAAELWENKILAEE
jgi:hypothetical protein